jgi:hypothetical protein
VAAALRGAQDKPFALHVAQGKQGCRTPNSKLLFL